MTTPSAEPEKCPTCGSDDRGLLGLDVTTKPQKGHWRQVRCAVPTYVCCDPWHAAHSTPPAPAEILPRIPHSNMDDITLRDEGDDIVAYDCRGDVLYRMPKAAAPAVAPKPQRAEMAQEYGRDHPWIQFDAWHEQHHEIGNIAWPCVQPLRCLWRFTRKTGVVLTQGDCIDGARVVAPQPSDERAAFEKWADSENLPTMPNGTVYACVDSEMAWRAWQARSALERK